MHPVYDRKITINYCIAHLSLELLIKGQRVIERKSRLAGTGHVLNKKFNASNFLMVSPRPSSSSTNPRVRCTCKLFVARTPDRRLRPKLNHTVRGCRPIPRHDRLLVFLTGDTCYSIRAHSPTAAWHDRAMNRRTSLPIYDVPISKKRTLLSPRAISIW